MLLEFQIYLLFGFPVFRDIFNHKGNGMEALICSREHDVGKHLFNFFYRQLFFHQLYQLEILPDFRLSLFQCLFMDIFQNDPVPLACQIQGQIGTHYPCTNNPDRFECIHLRLPPFHNS
ncbi:hypothetical protein D3C87_1776160 [compost metagenome]